jgi:4-amino-4-deoxy-L-arabinose transferase-like glycosyltransferase
VRADRLALVLLLLVAAALRFTGIAHHVVRGAADFDEQNNFLRPIERMAREGTLDPGVYQGYAGLFNWIAAPAVILGERVAGYPGAAAAARSVVAAFGVANVLLAFLVARRLAGPAAGLFAAALLAVSRLEVRAAHHVTPDVLVASALLGTLLLVAREAGGAPGLARRDLQIGWLTGLAAAVKFNGALAGIPGAVAAACSGGLGAFAARGVRMTLAAALAFAIAAPYALPLLAERGAKLTGITHYYGEKAERNQESRGGPGGLALATAGFVGSVGPVGSGLALLAFLLVRPRRALLPAGAVVAASLLALSGAAFVYPRHVVPPAAALAVLAGAGFGALVARLGRRALPVGALVAALAIGSQAAASVPLVVKYASPAAVDQAADWVEANVPGPALVLSALPRFALDPARYELRRTPRLEDVPPAAALQYDLLVTDITRDAEALQGFRTLARFPSEDGVPERTLSVLTPAARPALVAIETAVTRTHAAIELAFAPARAFRLEAEADDWPRDARLETRAAADASWQRARFEALRPTERERRRRGAPAGQAYVLSGDPVAGLRLSAGRPGSWTQARLALLALPEDATLPEAGPSAGRKDRRRQRRQ